MLSPMLDSLAAAGGQVPLRLTTTLFLAAAVYCALMALCLKIAGTMVAGWRLPFSSGRDRRMERPPLPQPRTARRLCPLSLSRLLQQASAAIRACAPSSARPPPEHRQHSTAHRRRHPLYAPATQAAEGSTASAATPFPRSDPRLGSLSRHYRPRNVQFQRTHS